MRRAPSCPGGGSGPDEGGDRAPRAEPHAARGLLGAGGRTADRAGRPSGAGARARQARPAASRWPRPARAAAVDRERGGAVGGRKRPGRPRGSLGRALDRGRYGAADPARGRRHGGAGHRLHRRARLLGQGRGWAGDHGRSPRHGGGPDEPRARRPLPRRQQQLVRPLRPFSSCRPQRPRHRGHRRDPRRRRHRHGARCKVHRRAGLRRRGRQHGERDPPRLPVAARPRRQPAHERCSQRRQPLLGRTAGVQPGIPARPARAALGGHSYRRRRRQRWSDHPAAAGPLAGQLARQPSRGVRSRSDGERNSDCTVLERRPVKLRRRPVPCARRPGNGHPLDRPGRPRRDRARGNVVLGPARRGRARVAAPGRPAAHRRRAGEPAHAERRRPRRAGTGFHIRCRLPRPRRSRAAAALPLARLRPSGAVGGGGQRHDAPGTRR